eukprot:TRINITY_DN24167_c0_g4_i2.p1 TRINITY_DN24167_c0_g4~~TRINITY_DN24167_c0_g4_i2.p1  ORF type:complete len:175 (-),score=46.29 TRINITY_DN24167_c0_g4_i2:222-722(-)
MEKAKVKILIVDFDVHRSCGTQQIMKQKLIQLGQVLLIDVFGALGGGCNSLTDDTSSSTLLVPLPPNAGDKEMLEVFQNIVIPRSMEFAPDLLIVSAGFDASEGDGEGFLVTPAGFQQVSNLLLSSLGGDVRSLWIVEGGYHQQALELSIAACLQGICDAMRDFKS